MCAFSNCESEMLIKFTHKLNTIRILNVYWHKENQKKLIEQKCKSAKTCVKNGKGGKFSLWFLASEVCTILNALYSGCSQKEGGAKKHAGIWLDEERTSADDVVWECGLSFRVARHGIINQRMTVSVLKYADLKYI